MDQIRIQEETKRKKVAWGISGSGDRLRETIEIMKDVRRKYQNQVDLVVYLSKAGEQVVKWYRLMEDLKGSFDKIWVETSSNSPFLAGELQMGKYEFLLIAPATSNTTAKISLGIADSLLSNAAIMGLKAFVSIYIMPSDYREGTVITKLPDGRNLKLRIRKEDFEHSRRLAEMNDVFVIEKPEDIYQIFGKKFNPNEEKDYY